MLLTDIVFWSIYYVLYFIGIIVSGFCMLGIVCCVWSTLSKRMYFCECAHSLDSLANSLIGNIRLPLLAIGLLGALIISPTVHQLVGIHDLELKPQGTYCFYVEAHREGGNTYILPAEVAVVKETFEVSETKSETHTYFFIQRVFFSNGGWLDTDDGNSDIIDEASLFYDDDNKWELTLLNEHAYSPLVKETDNADWLDITFLLIKLSSVAIFLYVARPKKTPHSATA